MKTCEDCGCKVYSGYCVNCNEEHYVKKDLDSLVNEYLKTVLLNGYAKIDLELEND